MSQTFDDGPTTATQKLLGNILKNRILEELKKPEEQRNFATIQETMDIFLASGKITIEQYSELTGLIIPVE